MQIKFQLIQIGFMSFKKSLLSHRNMMPTVVSFRGNLIRRYRLNSRLTEKGWEGHAIVRTFKHDEHQHSDNWIGSVTDEKA